MTFWRWGCRQFANLQFMRFLFVGGFAAGINWLSRIWFSDYLSFVVAVIAAYGVGVATAFVLNCVLVFPGSERSLAHRLTYFIVTNLLMFPVVLATSFLLQKYVLPALGMRQWVDEVAHGMALAFPVFLSFIVHKYLTFGSKPGSAHTINETGLKK